MNGGKPLCRPRGFCYSVDVYGWPLQPLYLCGFPYYAKTLGDGMGRPKSFAVSSHISMTSIFLISSRCQRQCLRVEAHDAAHVTRDDVGDNQVRVLFLLYVFARGQHIGIDNIFHLSARRAQ